MPGQPSARPIVPPPLPTRGGAVTPVPGARPTPIPVASRTPVPPSAAAAPIPTLSPAPTPNFSAAPIPTLAPAAPMLGAPAAVAMPSASHDPFAPFALTPVPLGPILELAREAVWPATVASAAAAETLLAGALRGGRGSGAAAEAAARVASALSPDECAALTGGPVAHDPALLRAAAALRLRLELALATVPAAGAPFDGPAAQVLLGEVDAVLAQVKAAFDAAEPALAASLKPIRLALVDGGVAFAAGINQLVPLGAGEPAPAPPREPAARLLTNERDEEAGPRRATGLWVALGVAAAIAASYHGWARATRNVAPPPTFVGAPVNTLGVERGGMRVLSTLPGKALNLAELERFKTAEQAKGNIVKQTGPGTWLVVPATTAARSPGGSP